MDPYATELVLRIDWSEQDLFGHVNNLAYLKYVQAARVNYWEKIGLIPYYEKNGIGPMLASTCCSFKKALHYPGKVKILTGLKFIKSSSFGLYHSILNEAAELTADAEDVIVLFDFKKQIKQEIPDFLREAIRKLEKR